MAKQRIDKIISSQSMLSRKDVEKLIKEKQVYINNELCKSVNDKVDPLENEIKIGGQKLVYREHLYLVLNKPKGVVSATTDNEKTVIDLVPDEIKRKDLFPVGRLDKDTTGILIITDDGTFAHKITSPRKDIEKTYIATLDSKINERDKDIFSRGMTLSDGTQYKPAYFEKLDEKTALIKISEGKYHQVKRMCKFCGHEVLELQRVKIGKLELDKQLKTGEMRELTEEEKDLIFG